MAENMISLDTASHMNEDELLALFRQHFKGKVFLFEDPFRNAGSRELIRQLKDKLQTLVGDTLYFSENPHCTDFIIRLCEPQGGNMNGSPDTNPQYGRTDKYEALYLIVYHGEKKKDVAEMVRAKEILVELMKKHNS